MGLHAERHIARLTAKDGFFYDAHDASVELKGCNWFGFNVRDGTGMLTGLWGPNSDNRKNTALSMDFKTIVLRMKLLGFNTVRLPFSFQARLAFTSFINIESCRGVQYVIAIGLLTLLSCRCLQMKANEGAQASLVCEQAHT